MKYMLVLMNSLGRLRLSLLLLIFVVSACAEFADGKVIRATHRRAQRMTGAPDTGIGRSALARLQVSVADGLFVSLQQALTGVQFLLIFLGLLQASLIFLHGFRLFFRVLSLSSGFLLIRRGATSGQ